MREEDLLVRNAVYRLFVERGRAPSSEDVAQATDRPAGSIPAALRRLHDDHAVVLDPDGAIRMANPFSAEPTPYRVSAAGRTWFANCAWDAFGVCAALHVDGDIETACADCGDRIEVGVRASHPSDDSLLFHCLVPATRWWDDIVFT